MYYSHANSPEEGYIKEKDTLRVNKMENKCLAAEQYHLRNMLSKSLWLTQRQDRHREILVWKFHSQEQLKEPGTGSKQRELVRWWPHTNVVAGTFSDWHSLGLLLMLILIRTWNKGRAARPKTGHGPCRLTLVEQGGQEIRGGCITERGQFTGVSMLEFPGAKASQTRWAGDSRAGQDPNSTWLNSALLRFHYLECGTQD